MDIKRYLDVVYRTCTSAETNYDDTLKDNVSKLIHILDGLAKATFYVSKTRHGSKYVYD